MAIGTIRYDYDFEYGTGYYPRSATYEGEYVVQHIHNVSDFHTGSGIAWAGFWIMIGLITIGVF